ncbi:MAG TPA: hypothetical protein GYA08_12835 [Chloroflexi bacterium]|nr:hypothetical protein [Chloroflexota bacterium]
MAEVWFDVALALAAQVVAPLVVSPLFAVGALARDSAGRGAVTDDASLTGALLKIQYVRLADAVLWDRNPKKHSFILKFLRRWGNGNRWRMK